MKQRNNVIASNLHTRGVKFLNGGTFTGPAVEDVKSDFQHSRVMSSQRGNVFVSGSQSIVPGIKSVGPLRSVIPHEETARCARRRASDLKMDLFYGALRHLHAILPDPVGSCYDFFSCSFLEKEEKIKPLLKPSPNTFLMTF